jgi:molybdopterin-dependent oxidoreductase-like protein protein
VRDLVPSTGWRIYTVAPAMPRFDPRTWRLRIDGLVERPQILSYGDLRRLPRAEQVSDFHCVTGWSVSGVRWAGVRITDRRGGGAEGRHVAGVSGGPGEAQDVPAPDERPAGAVFDAVPRRPTMEVRPAASRALADD